MPIKRLTCFVLGAGVSCAYGFPTGRELWWQLSTTLGGDNSNLSKCMAGSGFEYSIQARFAHELGASQLASVDRFLEYRPEWTSVGKAAIAAALLPCEVSGNLTNPEKKERIYEYVWRMLGPSLADVKSSKLSIVTFNYDRSLEYFLLNALRYSYGIQPVTCEEVLAESMQIVHVYGQLDRLQFSDAHGLKYGSPATPKSIQMAAERIELVSSSRQQRDSVGEAQRLVAEAEEVFFIGFGYDPINLERLNLGNRKGKGAGIGSAFGLEPGERQLVEDEFQKYGWSIHLDEHHIGAHQFLRRNVHHLS